MFRIFTRPQGAPINDPRVGQPMWSKPGTPLDRVAKAQRQDATDRYLAKVGVRQTKVHRHRREIARNMSRLPDDGYGRVRVARSVTGLSAAYTG